MTNIQKVIKVGAIALAIVIIINVFSLIISIFSGLTNIFFDDGKKVSNTYSYESVEKIYIDGINSFITIEEGSEFKVETIDVDNSFKCNYKNGILKIEESKLWIGNNKNGKIIITVPDDVVLEELSINTGAGKFVIDGIEAKEFDIDHGAGLLEITNSYFRNSDIDGGAGVIKVTNAILNDLDLDSGVGKVELMANITGNSEISCGVGEVDVTLLGNEEDYSIRIDKGIGNIKINGIIGENGVVYGNGINKLDIDGGIGNINIEFE